MTNNDVCDDPAYLTLLNQKKRFQLLNIPPVRYDNFADNPYLKVNPETLLNYSKFDLDMRRKAEILKYNQSTGTKTNKFTKKELYKQAISGSLQQRTYSNEYINTNSNNNQLFRCPNKRTPTTSSDVPGPSMNLYEDPSVPLYNYMKDMEAVYSNLPQDENAYETTWSYSAENDKNTLLDYVLVSSIFILYKDVERKTFEISIPVGLTFSGLTTVSASLSPNPIVVSNLFSPEFFSSNVFYGSNIVPQLSSIQYINTTISIDVDKISSQSFSGSCYLGIIKLKNIDLLINKGYIYDFKYKSNKALFDFLDDSYIDQFSFQLVFNISENYPFTNSNCTISGDIDPNTIEPIIVKSV